MPVESSIHTVSNVEQADPFLLLELKRLNSRFKA
jgi:hypothetical protein